VPTAILWVFFKLKNRKIFRSIDKMMIFASSLNAVRMFFYFVGYTFTSIGNAVIILYSWPVFATIFSVLYLKEKISKRTAGLLGVAFLGIILIYSTSEISFASNDFIGMSAMLLSAAVYASTVVIFKKESHKYTQFETVFYQNVIGAFIFLPFLFVNVFPTIGQLSILTIYAILIGLVGFSLFYSALKKIKASTASFLTYNEVLSALVFGVIILGETFTWNMIVGGTLIIGASVLLKKN
jgi:drug/metabolite transporter (DMT)-like permease